MLSKGEVEISDPLTTTSVPDDESHAVSGSTIHLYPLTPNPGGGDRTIRFYLARSQSNLSIALYDMGGRKITGLVDGARFAAGTHTLVFSPGDLPSGTYYVIMSAGGEKVTAAMQVVE